MKSTKMLFALLSVFAFVLAGADSQTASSWSQPARCELSVSGDALTVQIKGKNFRIYRDRIALKSGDFNTFLVEYTASGLPESTRGNLFFRFKGQRNFTEKQKLHLTGFIADGKKHKIELPLPESWTKSGKEVIELRFDPADNASSGTICFYQLKMIKKSRASVMTWNKDNHFSGWVSARNAELSEAENLLSVKIKGRYPRLSNHHVSIDPVKADCFEFRYRASGVPAKFSGSLYFHTPQEKDFCAGMGVYIRDLSGDGAWHTVRVNLPDSWKKCKNVTALRFDLCDQTESGNIELEFIRFVSGIPEKAGIFTPWPRVHANLPERSNPIPAVYWNGKMIASPADDGRETRRFGLRKTFDVPADMESAQLQITADDLFALYINGKKVADRLASHTWSEPEVYYIGKELIPEKKNIIGVEYCNVSGPGGVIFELDIFTRSGKNVKIVSDSSVKASVSAPPADGSWTKIPFDDTGWKPVRTFAAPPTPPWRRVLPFEPAVRMDAINLQKVQIPETGDAGKSLNVSFILDGKAAPALKARARLFSVPHGALLADYRLPLQSVSGRTVISVPLPQWFPDCSMKLELNIPGVGKLNRIFQYHERKLKEKDSPVAVVQTSSGPELRINGKSAVMFCGNVHVSEHQQKSRLHEVPVNFRTCYIKQNTADKTWIHDLKGDYDFSVIDRFVETVLSIDPNVKIILNMSLTLPLKFAPDFRDDLVVTSKGTTPGGSTLCITPSSKAFLEFTKKSIADLIHHCESAPYASKIGGYLLNYGETLEWQYYGSTAAFSSKAVPDESKAFRDAFRDKYGYELPAPADRMKDRQGLFFDPVQDAKLIAANEFFSESISNAAIEFCTAAKKAMKTPKLTGIYYGYHLEFCNADWRRQLAGHNMLKKVLDSGKVDFFLSPQSYSMRNLGDPVADMKPAASIALHGALSMIDDDSRTHLIPFNGYSQTVIPEQTRSVLRRNWGTYLCRRSGVWLLPLNGGVEFDSDEIIADLKQYKKAAEYQLKNHTGSVCETALVVDEETWKLMPLDGKHFRSSPIQIYRKDGTVQTIIPYVSRLFRNLIHGQYRDLSLAGIPFDCVLASDIPKLAGKYKLWIFADTFRYDEKIAETVKILRKNQNTLCWFYAPGYISEKNASLENMEKMTGFRLKKIEDGTPEMEITPFGKKPVLCGEQELLSPRFAVSDPDAKKIGTYFNSKETAAAVRSEGKSVSYFFGGNLLNPDLWREIARRSGCHIYSEGRDPLTANEKFIMLHARTAGPKEIILPRKVNVSDLFTGKLEAQNTDRIRFQAKLHETRVFFLGTPDELD